jgi:D-alanyl-D-alanine carboxypeptidase
VATLPRLALLAALLAAGCTVPEPPPVEPPPQPVLLFVWPTFPDPPTTPLPDTAVDGFQAVLDHAVEIDRLLPESRAGAAGITAAVVTDRGTWTGAAGVNAQSAPLGPAATSSIAGIGNTVVAAEILRLADAGRIDLDVPLSTYVAHRLTRNGATVRQFLGMQSGVGEPPIGEPVGTPGVEARYSDLNVRLLDRAIERVTGRTVPDAVRADLVTAPSRDGVTADAMSVARWGYDLYGARVLPPEDVAAMATPAGPGQIADGYRYGLGTMLFSQTLGLGDTVGHIGYTAGAQSILAVVPGRHIAVAVLIADDDKSVTGPVQDLFAVLNARLD